jgi:hypothetical protein
MSLFTDADWIETDGLPHNLWLAWEKAFHARKMRASAARTLSFVGEFLSQHAGSDVCEIAMARCGDAVADIRRRHPAACDEILARHARREAARPPRPPLASDVAAEKRSASAKKGWLTRVINEAAERLDDAY